MVLGIVEVTDMIVDVMVALSASAVVGMLAEIL